MNNDDIECRCCGARQLVEFVNLGMSPLCESFIAKEQLNSMEPFYPLVAFVCRECHLVQLQEYVTPEDIFTEYAPNFRSSILHMEVLSPLDMEREFHLTGGSISHGRMTLDQMFNLRPVAGYADYHTPIRGLFTCSAANHPGGGVMGTAGRNASREILREMKRL